MKTNLVGTPFTIDQLEGNNYNLDSILLSHFIKSVPKSVNKIYDFGSGQGVLMFYLHLKTDAKIIGYEIQEALVSIAKENIKSNNLLSHLESIQQDIKLLKIQQAEMIVSNPPYFKVTKGIPLSELESRKIARHEIHIQLADLIEIASKSLRTKGIFYMSYRPDRLQEVVSLGEKNNLLIKEIQFVHPYDSAYANLMLIKMVKDARPGIKVLKPLILYTSKQVMTKELESIYKGELDVTVHTKS